MIRTVAQLNIVNRIAKCLAVAVTLAAGTIANPVQGTKSQAVTGTVSSALKAAGAGAAGSGFSTNYLAGAIVVRHWTTRTVTVHVTPAADGDKTAQEADDLAAQSIALWNAKIGDFVTLQLTNAADANIDITFVKPGTLKGGEIGQTDVRFRCADQSIGYAATQINEGLSSAEQVQVVAHELGHALGIQGHSDDKHDLMYPYAHLPVVITDRDVNTIRMGYAAADANTDNSAATATRIAQK